MAQKSMLLPTKEMLDKAKEDLQIHEELQVASETGVHGLRYDDETEALFVTVNGAEKEIHTGGGGGGVAIGDVSGATATVEKTTASLKWSDPEDVVLSGITLAKWSGTLVVRKAGSAPENKADGTVVVDNKTRNTYASTALEDSGLEYGTTYYYRFFPYTDDKKYTEGSSVSVTPHRIVIENVPSTSSVLTYDGTEQSPTWVNYDSTKMTKSGDEAGTDAGDYTTTFTPVEGYEWSDGTVETKSVTWTIATLVIKIPTVSGSLTYTGEEQTQTFDDLNENYIDASGITGTNAGDYTATFSLKDTDNTTWTGGTTTDKTVDWSIEKANGTLTLSAETVVVDATVETDTVTASGYFGAITAESSDTSIATVSVDGSTITISSVDATSGTVNVTVTASGDDNHKAVTKTIKVDAKFSQIYGVEWDGTSTTKWSRTDAAEGFVNPSPAVANGTGSSPFDKISPWSGMVKEERTGGTMVAIPKYYFKWTKDGVKMKLQISTNEFEGSHVSPAHANRGDGKGERDVVYVGRYHCASDYKSKTGVKPQVNATRANFRTSIHNLGSTIWQYDFAMYWTIMMLYLVEFADWNSQKTIGYGCGNDSSTENMGSTDAMQYHTGTMAASRTTYGHVQYRYIEGLWSNVYDWCDGLYFSSANVYGINNPANFSDTSGGTLVATRPTSSGYTSAWSVPSVTGFEYALYPSAIVGSESTYVCDYCSYNASGVVLRVGGYYSQNQHHGAFYLYGVNTASSKYSSVGSRLQELP